MFNSDYIRGGNEYMAWLDREIRDQRARERRLKNLKGEMTARQWQTYSEGACGMPCSTMESIMDAYQEFKISERFF